VTIVTTFIGWRSDIGSFVARTTVPLAVVAVAVVLLVVRPTSLAISLSGLVFDVLGAITLAWGLLASGAVRLRTQAPMLKVPISRMPRSSRLFAMAILALARMLAARRPDVDASPTVVEEVVDTFWGLVMLVLGFVAQGIGVMLQLTAR
jgi:hypothetical protein